MSITVFSKQNCMQCKMTKRQLEAKGIPFEEKNTDDNPEVLEQLREEGFGSLPVVKAGEESWTGFQPPKIAHLAELVQSA